MWPKHSKAMMVFVVAVVGLLVSGPARAADTPAALAGTTLAAAAEVQKLQAGGAIVIDTRVAAEYAEAHIKGAINIPYHEKSAKDVAFDAAQDEFAVTKLPANKAAAIVMYCNGPSCWKSYKAGVASVKAGYTNLHWYRDGFPDWAAKGLPTE